MTFPHFLAFVAGCTVGLVAVAIAFRFNKNRIQELGLQSDERAEMVSARAARWTLLLILATTYVVWIVDNVLANRAGKEIVFLSPWGIMFFGSVLLYAVCYAYSNYLAGQSLMDSDPIALRNKGLLLTVAGLLMNRAGARIPFFHFITLATLIGGIFFMMLYMWKYRQEKAVR